MYLVCLGWSEVNKSGLSGSVGYGSLENATYSVKIPEYKMEMLV